MAEASGSGSGSLGVEDGVLTGGCMADYDVIKAIGKGKFSVVYRAKRKGADSDKPVALKKVALADEMDEKARLREELERLEIEKEKAKM